MSGQRRVPHFQLVDGIRRSPYANPKYVRKILTEPLRDVDVVLLSYPKSGTHWTQQIIQLILNRGESAPNFAEFAKRMPLLESHGTKWIEDAPRPRTARSHLELLRCSFSERVKYIYVARNPWDVCVSLYYHMVGFLLLRFEDGTFEDCFQAFLEGNLGYGDYFDHVSYGYSCRSRPNVLFLTYEELTSDTPGTILKIAHFLGEEYGRALEEDAQLFEMVKRKSTFDYMSRAFKEDVNNVSAIYSDFREMPDVADLNAEENGDRKSSPFTLFRKGKVNNWREHFTEEQIARMQNKIDKVAKEVDFMHLWDVKGIRA